MVHRKVSFPIIERSSLTTNGLKNAFDEITLLVSYGRKYRFMPSSSSLLNVILDVFFLFITYSNSLNTLDLFFRLAVDSFQIHKQIHFIHSKAQVKSNFYKAPKVD